MLQFILSRPRPGVSSYESSARFTLSLVQGHLSSAQQQQYIESLLICNTRPRDRD